MPKFTTKPEMIRRMSPDVREQLMQRSAAARLYINNAMRGDPKRQAVAELHAFMAIFHPDVPAERVHELARDIATP